MKFGKLYMHQKSKQAAESSQAMLRRFKLPTNFSEVKDMFIFEYYVKPISKCGQDVFIDTLWYVDKLRSKLKADKQQISQNKVSRLQIHRMWYFENLQFTAKVEKSGKKWNAVLGQLSLGWFR